MAQTLDEQARTRIKQWIDSTGITQTELSRQIGRNQAWMSRYLGGEFGADLETLQKMARVFNHSVSALLDTPADPREAALVEAYRAMPPELRGFALTLFQFLTRGRSRGRSR